MKKIEVVKWIEKKDKNEVIAIWTDISGIEVDPKNAYWSGGLRVENNSSLITLTMPSEVGGYIYIENNSSLVNFNKKTITQSSRLKNNNHHESIRDLISAKMLAKDVFFADN